MGYSTVTVNLVLWFQIPRTGPILFPNLPWRRWTRAPPTPAASPWARPPPCSCSWRSRPSTCSSPWTRAWDCFCKKGGNPGLVTQQQQVSWLGDLIVRSIYLNRNIPACSSTVETAFNVAICPRGKWLNKWINLIAEQILLLSLEGISGASIWWLYCRIIFIIYCTRNVMLCYPPAHRPLRDFMLNEFFSERSFLS